MSTGTADALKTIGGLLAVVVGLAALAIIASLGMGFVKSDNPSVVAIATSSFGVIGTIVGAYFGVKVGSQGTEKALDNTQRAIDGMRFEATKAQMFAAYLDPERAKEAIADIERLSNP